MLDIWLVYWIPVSKGMEDAAMSTPRIPPEDCPCGKAQTCYECTHPPSERDKVLEALKKDLQTRIISSSNQWSKGRNSGLLECCNIIDELRQAGEP